jgi:hypothetical protein
MVPENPFYLSSEKERLLEHVSDLAEVFTRYFLS